MILALVVVLALVVLALRSGRRRRRRESSADVMSDVIGLAPSYRGPRWGVGKDPRC